jgi:hypothetical protein
VTANYKVLPLGNKLHSTDGVSSLTRYPSHPSDSLAFHFNRKWNAHIRPDYCTYQSFGGTYDLHLQGCYQCPENLKSLMSWPYSDCFSNNKVKKMMTSLGCADLGISCIAGRAAVLFMMGWRNKWRCATQAGTWTSVSMISLTEFYLNHTSWTHLQCCSTHNCCIAQHGILCPRMSITCYDVYCSISQTVRDAETRKAFLTTTELWVFTLGNTTVLDYA